MPITTERYIPDSGSVTVNTVEMNGSVKTLTPSAPRRAERKINTLGGSATEVQAWQKAGDIEVTIGYLDDRSLAEDDTGLSGVLWIAYTTDTPLTDFVVVPAGSTIGMSEYTYSNAQVVQANPHADLDADTEEEAVQQAIIIADDVAIAQLA